MDLVACALWDTRPYVGLSFLTISRVLLSLPFYGSDPLVATLNVTTVALNGTHPVFWLLRQLILTATVHVQYMYYTCIDIMYIHVYTDS